MTIIILLQRIHDKLASRNVGAIELRASFALPERDKLVDWTITARDETETNAPEVPILRVWARADGEVVECDTFGPLDEATWAAIGMGYDAAPLRAPVEIAF